MLLSFGMNGIGFNNMKEIILKTDCLCKSYPLDGKEAPVLSNINMEIYKHDFTVIMGNSGAGKSTLLYLLSGMDNLTSGAIYLNNLPIHQLNENKLSFQRKQNIGFVFQQIHLLHNLTVLENIILPGFLLKKQAKKEVIEKAMSLLEQLGMSSYANYLPSQLSGGEKQRVAVIRSIINNPLILFADEPTGALNSQMGKEVLDILTALNEAGQTIIMVTHDIKACVRSNRVLYLYDGKLSGEKKMDKYKAENRLEREKAMLLWLEKLGW